MGGSALDHCRLAWQTRSGRPTSLYPALQAYVSLLLKVNRILPCGGIKRGRYHSTYFKTLL